jgi:cyclophilin family peptidyl-prolyl cis-trans isomerase
VFIVVMMVSLAAVGLAPGLGSTSSSRGGAEVEDDASPVAVETPEGLITLDGPEDTIDVSRSYQATIATDQGDIVVALDTENAPETANSFAYLAGQNFYDGLEFFWVIPGFDAQAGDPTCTANKDFACTGTGGPGYTLLPEGEKTSGRWSVVAPVTVAGADQVHGSQFVISMSDEGNFEGTVLGEVVKGQEILEALELRQPCFGSATAESGQCQSEGELPAALVIEDVVVAPA